MTSHKHKRKMSFNRRDISRPYIPILTVGTAYMLSVNAKSNYAQTHPPDLMV